MKKIFSLLLIMTFICIMTIGVYCQTDKYGGNFNFKEVKTQEYIPAKAEIPEKSTWSAVEKVDKRIADPTQVLTNYDITANATFNETDSTLDYVITVKGKIDATSSIDKTFTDKLNKEPGEQSITVTWELNSLTKKLTCIFDVTKTVLQEHENAVPEQLGIKEIHIIGYKYTKGKYKGCEVKFRQDIIKNIITKTSEGIKNGDITSDYKKLLSMRPFKPNTTRVWTKGKWLYLRCDWTIPTPKPTQSTSSPSESIAPSDSPSESIEPSTEPSVDSTVNPTNNVVYGNNSLPKTGESENVALIIAGILVIIAGIFTIVKICKPNN